MPKCAMLGAFAVYCRVLIFVVMVKVPRMRLYTVYAADEISRQHFQDIKDFTIIYHYCNTHLWH